MKKGLTKKDIKKSFAKGCGQPNCINRHKKGPVYFHCGCNEGNEVTAGFEKGIITISCAKCNRLIIRIAVKGAK